MEQIKKRTEEKIVGLGCLVPESIDEYIVRAVEHTKILLNQDEIHDEFYEIISDIACGNIVKDELIKTGETKGAPSSIREGDVSISYKEGESLYEIAHKMANPDEIVLAVFRRIKW